MTWSDVPFDLWKSEVVWLFLKYKEGVPEDEALSWHWKSAHGPAQTYVRLSVRPFLEAANAGSNTGIPGGHAATSGKDRGMA